MIRIVWRRREGSIYLVGVSEIRRVLNKEIRTKEGTKTGNGKNRLVYPLFPIYHCQGNNL